MKKSIRWLAATALAGLLVMPSLARPLAGQAIQTSSAAQVATRDYTAAKSTRRHSRKYSKHAHKRPRRIQMRRMPIGAIAV